jgi:integrase
LYVPRTRWLSEAEVDALIEVLPSKRAAVVAFIVATSATYPSEVTQVTRSMISGDVVRVPGTKRSTRDRTLRVPSHGRRFLKFALKHATRQGEALFEPWSNIRGDLHDAARLLSLCPKCRENRLAWARHVEGATKPGTARCKACERTPTFPPLCPTDLRRTFVQWLVRSGVPYELVYPMTGHNSPRMLEQVYGKRDATAVADLVELALKKAPKTARRRVG